MYDLLGLRLRELEAKHYSRRQNYPRYLGWIYDVWYICPFRCISRAIGRRAVRHCWVVYYA